MDQVKKVEPEENPNNEKKEHLNVMIIDGQGNKTYFRIKSTTPFKKMFDVYISKQSLVHGSVRFTFDGNRLSGTETAAMVGMENDDIIDAMVEQTGGNR